MRRMWIYDHAYTPAMLRGQMRALGFDVLFLRRVNVLPSLAAELLQPAVSEDGAPVKGIALRSADDWRGRALGAYLAVERVWLSAGLPGLPVGHTILAIGRRV